MNKQSKINSKDSQIYKKEYSILNNSKKISTAEDININELLQEYTYLSNRYEELLKKIKKNSL